MAAKRKTENRGRGRKPEGAGGTRHRPVAEGGSRRPAAGDGGLVVLGSASERRRKILRALGVRFEAVAPRVREVSYARDPRRTAVENARRKHAWCRRRYPGRLIITADTVIDLDGRLVEKPRSVAEARAFLRRFSGRRHTVLTALVLGGDGRPPVVRVDEARVTFKKLRAATVERYLARVNPLDKAGAYDIDQHGDWLIAALEGSHSNVMGLPAALVREEMRRWRERTGTWNSNRCRSGR